MADDGVLIPLITPLDEVGRVCERSVARLIAQSRHTASGYLPCLTSGEGWRVSRAQWEAMVRATLDHADGRRVIVGIERPTTDEVMAYAGLARWLGARAIMVTSPFGAGATQAAIVAHYRRLHDDSGLDVYIYNESSLSQSTTGLEALLAIAELPRVVGIKDSVEAGRDAAEIAALRARGVAYFAGWEHHLARGLPLDGCVVSLANLEPALCRLGLAGEAPAVRAEIARLTDAYALMADDWYRHVKRELALRGVIATDRVVA